MSITTSSGTETYSYDADGNRTRRGASDGTRIYLQGGLWEEQTSSGTIRTSYLFNGQVVAQRDSTSGAPVVYLHGDHLGSVGLTSSTGGALSAVQEFDPWGAVRSGASSATQRNYTGQYLDGTGLLFYNARYYDPVLARFISPDTVVPGAANGSLDGIALKPLTVGFVEPEFIERLYEENQQPFWFQRTEEEQEDAESSWGPENPQSLNRYTYVLNSPLTWTDPTGHSRRGRGADGGGGGGGGSRGGSGGVQGKGQGAPARSSNTSSTSGRTEPQMPAREIVNERGVQIVHNYHGQEHGPAHAHVIGGGPKTRIGANGKPLEGDPELTRLQRQVIDDNKSLIRSTLNKIGRWLDYQDNLE